MSSDAFDVALSSSGIAYVSPRTDQSVAIHAIDPAGCKESAVGQIYAGTRVVM